MCSPSSSVFGRYRLQSASSAAKCFAMQRLPCSVFRLCGAATAYGSCHLGFYFSAAHRCFEMGREVWIRNVKAAACETKTMSWEMFKCSIQLRWTAVRKKEFHITHFDIHLISNKIINNDKCCFKVIYSCIKFILTYTFAEMVWFEFQFSWSNFHIMLTRNSTYVIK